MEFNKTKIDDVVRSVVNLKLVDPLGKAIAGLRYQVRQGERIVSRGTTDTKGKLSTFESIVGTILAVYVERFGTTEFKEIKKIIPWSEDFRIKLVSEKWKKKLDADEHEGKAGEYRRKTYKVRKDDTLGLIATQFETTADQLAALNGIAVTDIIYVDQILKVPSKPSAPPSTIPAPVVPATSSVATAAPANGTDNTQSAEMPAPSTENSPTLEESTGASEASQPVAAAEPAQEPIPREGKIDSTPATVTSEQDRGESGTPKTSASLECDESACLKIGDQGPLIEELNIRLHGFGGTMVPNKPWDEYTEKTAKAVKQFQRDFMKTSETGVVCGDVLRALDLFRSSYPINMAHFKCQCNSCGGFGRGYTSSASVQYFQSNGQPYSGTERPGIHRALLWTLRAAKFYVATVDVALGYNFFEINSGYRCWQRNKEIHRKTINHMGNALDIRFKKNNVTCSGNVLQRLREDIFIKRIKARMGWGNHYGFAMESNAEGAASWVHIDMRDVIAPWDHSRYYAVTNGACDGASLVELARQESRFQLLNCDGIQKTTPSATLLAASPASPLTAQQLPSVSAAKSDQAPKQATSASNVSSERRAPKFLDLSTPGLDFIKGWEDYREFPYEDARHYCTIGYGHLIATTKCSKLASEGNPEYNSYKSGLKMPAAEELLRKDVRAAIKAVKTAVQVPLYQHEFDALVSLAFNTNGIAKFPNLMAKLNTSNYSGCCDEFADITNRGIPGLVKRRQAEMMMFRNNKYDSKH